MNRKMKKMQLNLQQLSGDMLALQEHSSELRSTNDNLEKERAEMAASLQAA